MTAISLPPCQWSPPVRGRGDRGVSRAPGGGWRGRGWGQAGGGLHGRGGRDTGRRHRLLRIQFNGEIFLYSCTFDYYDL